MSARAALADRLSLAPASPTKTFVLEVHTEQPEAMLAEMFDGPVTRTSDGFLHRAEVDGSEMWVDRIDSRFWSFHTDLPAQPARRFLKERVERSRDLDWLWLPAQHLRRVSRDSPARQVRTDFRNSDLAGLGHPGADLRLRASGDGAARVLEHLAASGEGEFAGVLSLESIQVSVDDGVGGVMTEAVDRQGVFACSGDSLETHLQFVRGVVSRYAGFVKLLEAKALGWDALPEGGGHVSGSPVGIRFAEPVQDLDRFVETLFTSREPFRLWGVPRVEDGVAEIDAVDLHVGQRLRVDVGETWMRIYLERGGCGNTVARLISNLQHRFDSRLALSDPELQAAMEASGV